MLKEIPPVSIESVDRIRHVFWERGRKWTRLCEMLEHGNPELWGEIDQARVFGMDPYGEKAIIEFFQKWYGLIHFGVQEQGKIEGVEYRVPILSYYTKENTERTLDEMRTGERYPARDTFDMRNRGKLTFPKIDHLKGFVDDEISHLGRMQHVVRVDDIKELECVLRYMLNMQAGYDRIEGIARGVVPYTSVYLNGVRHHQARKAAEYVRALAHNPSISIDGGMRQPQLPSPRTPQRAALLYPRRLQGQ